MQEYVQISAAPAGVMESPMWDIYERNFLRIQILIAVGTYVAFRQTHLQFVAAAFFVTMQLGAVVGSALGVRLARRRALLPVPSGRSRWSRA